MTFKLDVKKLSQWLKSIFQEILFYDLNSQNARKIGKLVSFEKAHFRKEHFYYFIFLGVNFPVERHSRSKKNIGKNFQSSKALLQFWGPHGSHIEFIYVSMLKKIFWRNFLQRVF